MATNTSNYRTTPHFPQTSFRPLQPETPLQVPFPPQRNPAPPLWVSPSPLPRKPSHHNAKPPIRPRNPIFARLTRSNIPMTLTWARMAAIPLLCVTHAPPPLPYHPTLSALLFAAAAFTDFLDGYLARRWQVQSALGAFLDPVADKLLVAVALTLIVARFPPVPPGGIVIPLAAAIILAREIFVSALREWMALRGRSESVSVGFWGKVKTAAQMVAVTVLLYGVEVRSAFTMVGVGALVLAAVLAVVSAVRYLMSAIKTLTNVQVNSV